jgi:cytochrome c553
MYSVLHSVRGSLLARAVVPLVLAAGALTWNTGCQSAPAAGPERGEYLFTNYCTPCHMGNGAGKPEVAAPAIAGLPVSYVERQLFNYRNDLRGYHFDDIEGLRMKPMSRTLMSDTDVKTVAAYVSQMAPHRPAPSLDGDAEKGKALYTTCSACHQPDGLGNEALNAPPLVNTHDWYLVTQLKKFKGGVRGQRDAIGKSMAPMAAGLTDEQAMKDVVAYVQTLRK